MSTNMFAYQSGGTFLTARAYALNKAVTPGETQTFVSVAHHASETMAKYASGAATVANPRAEIEHYIQTRQATPQRAPMTTWVARRKRRLPVRRRSRSAGFISSRRGTVP